MDIIQYKPASLKFGVWTPQGWHRHTETCRNRRRPCF